MISPYSRKKGLTFAKDANARAISKKSDKKKHCTTVICENTGQIFNSVKEAATWFGIAESIVSLVLRERYTGGKYGSDNYKGLAFDYKPMF